MVPVENEEVTDHIAITLTASADVCAPALKVI
jgi:hypothetical protein